MLRDITLGQYYPADSVIHKLDPRVKLFATFIYIISLFCFKGIAALLVATVFLIFCIRTSKVHASGKSPAVLQVQPPQVLCSGGILLLAHRLTSHCRDSSR